MHASLASWLYTCKAEWYLVWLANYLYHVTSNFIAMYRVTHTYSPQPYSYIENRYSYALIVHTTIYYNTVTK